MLQRHLRQILALSRRSTTAQYFTRALAAATCSAGAQSGQTSAYSTSQEADAVDCVVVGAGVVGLACARAAALSGYEVVVLEQESSFGTATSSRHSEVIHAGIYYPQGSLKARLCVEGKHMLYDYCSSKGIRHKNIGKLIVASNERQVPKLKQLQAFAAANGVPDLQLLSGADAVAAEPALAAAAALLSPSTGILDSHSYMEALLADAEETGAVLATHSRLLGARPVPGSFFTTSSSSQVVPVNGSSRSSQAAIIDNGSSTSSANSSSSSSSHTLRQHLLLDVQDTTSGTVSHLATRWMINAAGLNAQAVALAVAGLPSTAVPQQHLAKGNYFSLACKAPFSRLIYPLPEDGGLGVHLTLDLAGQAKFGPDVEWTSHIDYSVNPGHATSFYPAIRSYYPSLPDGALQPSYSGIRPKVSGPGQPPADFMVAGPQQHGVAGLVNLFGIESPGLTSSLALAEVVLGMLE